MTRNRQNTSLFDLHISLLSHSLEDNVELITNYFHHTDDLKVSQILKGENEVKFIFLETLCNEEEIEKKIKTYVDEQEDNEIIKHFIEKTSMETTIKLADLTKAIAQGKCVFLFADDEKAYIYDVKNEQARSPDEPDSEKAVRSSHLGFVESLHTNLNLLRQHIQSKDLIVQYKQLGGYSKQQIAIVYLNNIASLDIVEKINEKIAKIPENITANSGNINEFIEKSSFSPFPQNLLTERPDRLESFLREGKIGVFFDNSSDAIVLPVTFFAFFQSPDDYTNRFYSGTLFRILRLMSFVGTLLFPPLYIALVGFHFEIIPYEMILLVKESIEGVPFSPFFEALFMAITVELIREAGIRLPSPIGETTGIVGGLIIGDAVVNAGLVSNVMVIVIALTAIMSFAIPSYELGNTVRILSFPLMVAAAMFGFVGIVFAGMFILAHMCKLESFGTPFLYPLAPLHPRELLDTIIRFPLKITLKK